MDKEILKKKRDKLRNLAKNSKYSFALGDNGLYHYTSITTLFSLLDSDSFWASSTRFSNDSSEQRVFPLSCLGQQALNDDNYMLCLSASRDCLSQWRGYCYHGGASLKFNMATPQDYSVLHTDYDVSKQYERITNAPIPVIYVPVPKKHCDKAEESENQQRLQHLEELWQRLTNFGVPLESLVPQFKDQKFQEEQELRLLFENTNNELASCIRFRTLKNNVKVPYIVVKIGDAAKNFTKCDFDIERYEKSPPDALIQDFVNCKVSPIITIPQGSNQESIYYRMEKVVNQFNRDNTSGTVLRIQCAGHLPVEEIIVAPTYDRERKAEQIQRYCWSKYWLRNTKITCSEIPYIPPSEVE